MQMPVLRMDLRPRWKDFISPTRLLSPQNRQTQKPSPTLNEQTCITHFLRMKKRTTANARTKRAGPQEDQPEGGEQPAGKTHPE